MIKQILAYIASWVLYWTGDRLSAFAHSSDDQIEFWYSIYSNIMRLSCSIQDWGGNKTPWTK